VITDRHQHQLGDALTAMFNRRVFSRRSLLTGTTTSFAAAGLGTLDNTFTTFDSKKSQTTNDGCDGEVLGQDPFRYRAHRHWGMLDRTHYPVKDCHGIFAYRKPRLAHYGSRRAHITCYTASLHLVDFKCASSFGEAQVVAKRKDSLYEAGKRTGSWISTASIEGRSS